MAFHDVLIWVLVAMQVFDLASTHYIIRRGYGTEANPWLNWLFQRLGHLPVLTVVKVICVVVLLVYGSYVHLWGLIALALLYAWVCWNNAFVIVRARK